MKFFLAHDADISMKANDGTSVLHEAARCANAEVLVTVVTSVNILLVIGCIAGR